MKKIIPLLITLFLSSFLNAQSPTLATSNIIVQLQSGLKVETFLKNNETNFSSPPSFIKTLSPKFNIHLLAFSAQQSDILSTLNNLPEVTSAQWDQPLEYRTTVPNDPLWSDEWHMERIGLPEVWNVSTGGTTANGDEIVVAVIDSGFDLTHEDLQDNIWQNKKEAQGQPNFDDDGNGFEDDVNGWNFINNSPTLSVTGHGTGVSGIIGADGDNNLGISGVNWNVKMMFLTIDLISEVIAAFDYIIYQRELYNNTNGAEGAFIVAANGSFGKNAVFCSEEPLWGSMYDKLGEVGVLSVAATANENWDVDEVGDMPTTCVSDYLIAVTATDIDDIRVSNSAFGPASIDLAAPGRNISALALQDKYTASFGGTSSACPHVTGAIALLYSMPCTTFADLAIDQPAEAALLMKRAILENVVQLSSLQDKILTSGRLDIYESMKYLHAYCIAKEEERTTNTFKEIYISEKDFIRLFPNPVADRLQVDFSIEDFTNFSVRVFNSIGQEMEIPKPYAASPFMLQTFEIDVSDWSAGTYFISITNKEGEATTSFVKI